MLRNTKTFTLCAGVIISVALAYTGAMAQSIEVVRPVANAIVRETVPIRVASRDLPQDGFVAIYLDGDFITARSLPPAGQPVYLWDTKASHTTPDDPDTPKYVADGAHNLVITIYDSANHKVGSQSVPVHVANKIVYNVSQGVMLAYKWHVDDVIRYNRVTDLSVVNGGAGIVPGTAVSSNIIYTRSVEDGTDKKYLIRDKVDPSGHIVKNGQSTMLQAAYSLKSKYRTVNSFGEILTEMTPLTAGDHFAFSIPVLPGRRVTVGDSWRSPLQVSLNWATTNPAIVEGESRLESFEWANGYPTAKIHVTYNGPVTFPMAAGSAFSAARIESVNINRLVYFAYNSGRLISITTTMDITSPLTPEQMGELSIGSRQAPAQAAGGGGDNGGGGGGGNNGGGGGGNPANVIGADQWGNLPGSPYWNDGPAPGGPMVSQPAPVAASVNVPAAMDTVATSDPVQLKFTETTTVAK